MRFENDDAKSRRENSMRLRSFIGVGVLALGLALSIAGAEADQDAMTGELVFVSQRGEDTDIFTISPDDEPTPLIESPAEDRWPRFSPDKQKVVFSRRVSPPSEVFHGNVHVFDRQSGQTTQLTFDDLSQQAAWSPDGKQIAFDGFRGVQVMNADGPNRRLLVNGWYADRPRWTSNGQSVVYHVLSTPDASMSPGIYMLENLLINSQLLDHGFDPSVSPDGTTIAFQASDEGDADVFVMDREGTNVRNLTPNSDADEFQPVWSPDGEYIAFVTDRDGDFEIYVMAADGTNPTNMTNRPDSNEFDPDWR